MSGIDALLNGFRKFREIYYDQAPDLYRDILRKGQNPRIAVIACSDSRVDPAIVFQVEAGEIFAVRNVAALVPPCEDDEGYHGTSAALEFAVKGLGVDHIVVLGHAHCGGVEAMVRKQEGGQAGGRFIAAWTGLLIQARQRALTKDPSLEGDAVLRASEREAVRLSLENLMTFPFVRKRVDKGVLKIHGWYLNIFEGQLESLDPESGCFVQLDRDESA